MPPHFSAMDQFRCLQLLSYDPASMTVPDRGARAGASETLRGAARHVLEPVLKGDVHGFSMFFGWTLHVLASNSCGKPKSKPIADGLYKRYEWICAVILGMVLMIGLRWSSAEAEIAGNDLCPSSHEESWLDQWEGNTSANPGFHLDKATKSTCCAFGNGFNMIKLRLVD